MKFGKLSVAQFCARKLTYGDKRPPRKLCCTAMFPVSVHIDVPMPDRKFCRCFVESSIGDYQRNELEVVNPHMFSCLHYARITCFYFMGIQNCQVLVVLQSEGQLYSLASCDVSTRNTPKGSGMCYWKESVLARLFACLHGLFPWWITGSFYVMLQWPGLTVNRLLSIVICIPVYWH